MLAFTTCRACIPLLGRLDRYDALMFLAFWVDALGDALKLIPLVVLLQTNFHASYGLSRAEKAAFLACAAAVITVVGRVLDTRPRDAPLMAVVYAKPVEMAAIALLLVLDVSGLAAVHPMAACYAAFFVLLVLLAPAESLSSLASQLQIKRACVGRESELDVRRAMFQFRYAGASNLAYAAAGGLITACLVLAHWYEDGRGGGERGEGDVPVSELAKVQGYRLVLILSLVFDAVSVGVNYWAHTVLFRLNRTLQPPEMGNRADSGWLTRSRELADEDGFYYHPRDFDICKFDCSRISWRQLQSSWSNRALWSYVMLMTSLIGSYCLSLQLEDTQPTYLQNRFNDQTYYTLIQAMNPMVVALVGIGIPFLPYYHMLSTPRWLMIGSTLQLFSPLWVIAWPNSEWAFVPFNVQFAIGEAVSFPLLDEYAMRMAPKGEEAFYVSSAATPRFLGKMLSFIVSTQLLNAFCASPASCAAPETVAPVWVWFISMVIAATTPIGLLILWLRGCVLDDRETASCCSRSWAPSNRTWATVKGRGQMEDDDDDEDEVLSKERDSALVPMY